MNVKDRIFLFLEEKNIKVATFERASGLSNGYLKSLRKEPSREKLQGILDNYPELNSTWLLTGEGEMLRDSSSSEARVVATDEESYQRALRDGIEMIPEREAFFRGGGDGETNDSIPIVAHWHIPMLRVKDAEIVTLHGDSMYPVIPSGSKVVIHPYPFRADEPLSIEFGQIYAIVVKDEDSGLLTHYIKYLRKHPDPAKARTYWLARSANPEYDDFEIRIRSVNWLGRVCNVVLSL